MPRQSSLRIGVIGAGLMGGTHIESIREIIKRRLLPVSLDAIAGLNHPPSRKLAEEINCAYHNGGEKLLAEADVDVVVIATPTKTHLPLVRKAASLGRAIFLEKPLGRNYAEALKIRDIIKTARVPHQVGLILRFSPTYSILRELLNDPKNGPFILARFRDDQFLPVRGVYESSWRADVKQAGGGPLIEHSIHDIDVLHWFFGEPAITDATTLPSQFRGIEKLAAIQMKFANGGRGQCSTVWHQNFSRENERHIELFFENRLYSTAGGFTSPLAIEGPRGPERIIGKHEIERRFRKMIGWKDRKNSDFPSTAAYEMYVFLKNVLNGSKSSAVDVSEGVAAHRTIEFAYRIARFMDRKR